MRNAFLEYAYSVIYSRALPDARDGLKPVQRRILFQMTEMGLRPDRAPREVPAGRRRGHGQAPPARRPGHLRRARPDGPAVHHAGAARRRPRQLRLARRRSRRRPLHRGPAGPGRARSWSAASTRTSSTSSRTTTTQQTQPEVLPAAFPNLLVNGASGIAVGMATNMAPHNLVEVVGAARHLIAQPDLLARRPDGVRPGPDLPTGGKIVGLDGIRDAYATGRGAFRTRATARVGAISPRRKGHRRHRAALPRRPREGHREDQGPASRAKKLTGIADVNDLTDRAHGLRLVIEIKNGFDPEAVLEQLYRLTPLEDSFNINNVALVDGQPRTLGLQGAAAGLRRLTASTSSRRRTAVPARPARGAAAPRRGSAHRDPRHRRGHPGHPRAPTTPRRRAPGSWTCSTCPRCRPSTSSSCGCAG